jgi:hypothetical protein
LRIGKCRQNQYQDGREKFIPNGHFQREKGLSFPCSVNHNGHQKGNRMLRQNLSKPIRSAIGLILMLGLILPEVVRSAPLETMSPAQLNLVIVEGEGAINNVRQRTAREPIVQVEDENHKPIAGAVVLFILPDSGPSGVFSNGSRSLQVVTDSSGRVAAKGLRTNNLSGKYQIRVEASYQGMNAVTVITQANAVLTTAAGGVSAKLIAILAGIGGAAVAGAVIATRNGNGSSKATTITPGQPTVGGPQ